MRYSLVALCGELCLIGFGYLVVAEFVRSCKEHLGIGFPIHTAEPLSHLFVAFCCVECFEFIADKCQYLPVGKSDPRSIHELVVDPQKTAVAVDRCIDGFAPSCCGKDQHGILCGVRHIDILNNHEEAVSFFKRFEDFCGVGFRVCRNTALFEITEEIGGPVMDGFFEKLRVRC